MRSCLPALVPGGFNRQTRQIERRSTPLTHDCYTLWFAANACPKDYGAMEGFRVHLAHNTVYFLLVYGSRDNLMHGQMLRTRPRSGI